LAKALQLKNYILGALLLLAVAIAVFKPEGKGLTSIANTIQRHLNTKEEAYLSAVSNKKFVSGFFDAHWQTPDVSNALQSGVYFFGYKDDSLAVWTSNDVAAPPNITAIDTGATFIKLKNGWYALFKHSSKDGGTTILGLAEVKREFPFENRFLSNAFIASSSIPNNIQLSETEIKGSVAIHSLGGEPLFYVYAIEADNAYAVDWLQLLVQILIGLLLAYYINTLAINLKQRYGFMLGFGVLLCIVLVVRLLSLYLDLSFEWNRLEVFNPKYYASSLIAKSLGDLMINCALLLWMAFFAVYHQPSIQVARKAKWYDTVIGILVIYIGVAAIVWLFKTLVLDSVISFQVYNILSLGLYSLYGMLCISIVVVVHFLLSKAILQYLLAHGADVKAVAISAIVLAGMAALFAIDSAFDEAILVTALWALVFVLLAYIWVMPNWKWRLRDMIIAVSCYSILCTILIENLYERRERNQRDFFASKLITERDFIAEYLFNDAATRIAADPFVKNYFSNPFISNKELLSRISSLYLSGYFNKYDIGLYVYDTTDIPIKNKDSLSLIYFQTHLGQKENSLAYITDSVENYLYLGTIPYYIDSVRLGTLAIKLAPKIYYGQNVYPELLLGEHVNVAENNYKFQYAVYYNDKLIGQYGDYPFTYYWDKNYAFNEEEDIKYIELPEWEHLIQRFPNGKKVIVTIAREPLFEPIATFSYLFTFLMLAVIAALLLAGVFIDANILSPLLSSVALSFRTRINYSMLLMIVVSFIIIGFVTIGFFRKQYNDFNTDRMLRKAKVIHATLEYFMQQRAADGYGSINDNSLEFEVARLADINSIDVNVFDAKGDLMVSSQSAIYDKGLVSRKMNPEAYFEMASTKSSQLTIDERIGGLNYIATYAPIRNTAGDAVAYLGVPYFAQSENISEEVSGFLVALMNVYVFLLICAAMLAYFISNSITRPLTIISEKLRILNLNKKNEPIQWDSKDEIGVLIGEYNKMITELERSAKILAKSEREGAWREMAKQIAHEIKNPLTPMKLSIQYLQRSIDSGDPNVPQLAKKVTRTLEEQIENLSAIATAFSSFAKMPRPENEVVDLNDLLRSITDLFNREQHNVKVLFDTDIEGPEVYADRNQLISVFNNLVKNAIQSIPDDKEGHVAVHIVPDGELIVVVVEDNGSGIPEELYDKVFVPNFTTKSSGTGLGLAISKQIIDTAGGRIWFESKPGEGTTFYVRMPRYQH
jgi:signal transduction histidine kinase